MNDWGGELCNKITFSEIKSLYDSYERYPRVCNMESFEGEKLLLGTQIRTNVTEEDLRWLETANRLTREAGQKGHWICIECAEKGYQYAYICRERFTEQLQPGDSIVPFPGEIICLWKKPEYKKLARDLEIGHYYPYYNSRENCSYWDCVKYLGNYILTDNSIPQIHSYENPDPKEVFKKLFKKIYLETK